MKKWDIMLGFATGGGSIWLSHVNVCLAVMVTAATLVLLLMRIRREWRHRND